MKLFNVSFSVQITEIGSVEEIEEPKPPLESLVADRQKDSPLKDAARLMDGYIERVAPTLRVPAFNPYGPSGDGVSMVENVKVAASSFEDLQAILLKFHATGQALSEIR